MNYQPFYHMHVLISDDLLSAVQANLFAINAFIIATLFVFAILVIILNDLLRYAMRAPKRNYPPHGRKVLAND